MPAVSKAQQRFMGMVHATQKGDMENPSPEVAKAVDSMSDEDAKDFASTKHKGLPTHVKEILKEIIRGVIRDEGAFASVMGGPEDGRNLTEMSPKDIHFKAILAMYDKSNSFGKKKVGVAVSNNPNASRNKIIDDLKDLDYHEILDAEDKLGIKESVNEGKTYSNKFAAWFTGTVLNNVKHPTYGKHQLTADQIEKAPGDYKDKLFKAIETAVKNGDITPDIIKKNESVNEGLSKDTVKRTLTSDKNAYFLTKDGDGWILDITPKGAQHSTFHQKFNVKDLGKGHLGMKYKLTESEEHDCGCNENHDCGCGGVHEHTHIHEDLSADANGIAGLTASRASAVKDFLEKHNINSNKLYLSLKKGGLKDRLDFVTALVGKPGNPIQKKVISQFSK